MKKAIFSLCLLMLLGGCSTVTFTKPSLKSRFAYLKANDIAEKDIRIAIRRGTVVYGMTEEQVLITWGEPTKKELVSDEAEEEEADTKWYYKGVLQITVEFADGLVLGVYHNT